MVRTVNRRWRNKERAKRIGPHRGQLRPGRAGPPGRRRLPLRARARARRRRHRRPRDRPHRAARRPRRGRRRARALGAALLIDELHEVPPLAAQRARRRRPPGQPGVAAGRRSAAPACRRSVACCPRPARTPSGCSASARSARLSPGGHPPGVRGAGRRARCDVRGRRRSTSSSRSPAATRSSSRPTASTCGTSPTTRRSPATTSSWPCRVPTASSSTRSSGPATTGRRRPSGGTCTPWPTSATATSRRPTSPPQLGHDQPSRVSPQRDGLLDEGPHLRPRAGDAGVHRPAHGRLPAPARRATVIRARPVRPVTFARPARRHHRDRRGVAARLPVRRQARRPLLLNDSLYYSIQAGRNSEGDWFREAPDGAPRRRARAADVAVPDAVEPRRPATTWTGSGSP